MGELPIGPRPSPDRPVTPGSDLAGIVVGVGEKVRSIQVGDAVFGVQMPFRRRGAWAEICCIDERWLTAKPETLPFGAAAACGISGLVALSGISALRLRTGSRVVIVGATGGIGGMAVQLATRTGAEVIGICGRANVERAYRLGCAIVFDYKAEPWARILSANAGKRVDGVLDLVGGRDIEEAGRRVITTDRRFVTVVGPERFIGDRALGWTGVLSVLLRVGFRIISSRIRGPRYILAGPGPSGGAALADVARAAAEGVLPPIDSTVPFELEPMRHALRRAAAHRNNGRSVVQMDAPY